MEIEISESKGVVVVSPKKKLDAVTVLDFESKLNELINKGEKGIIIDFSELDYISSAGLRCIVSASRKMKKEHGSLVMACLDGMVAEVFKLAGFYEILPLYDTLEEAMENL